MGLGLGLGLGPEFGVGLELGLELELGLGLGLGLGRLSAVPAPPRLRAPSSSPRRSEVSSGGEGGEGGVDDACAASLAALPVSAPEALSCGPRPTSALSACSSSAVALAPRSAWLGVGVRVRVRDRV